MDSHNPISIFLYEKNSRNNHLGLRICGQFFNLVIIFLRCCYQACYFRSNLF